METIYKRRIQFFIALLWSRALVYYQAHIVNQMTGYVRF